MEFNIDKMKKVEFAGAARRLGIAMAVLFGSAATGRKKPGDIDVAVFLRDRARRRAAKNVATQQDITLAIASLLGVSADALDAVFVNPQTSALLQYHIARDGKLLFGAVRQFMEFRLRAMRQYYDREKFRRAQEQYLARAYAR